MIVFDHLSPRSDSQKGQFQYYGPDMSFDAFVFEKGKWTYKKDVDARNDTENEGKVTRKPEMGLTK